ncbi:MAG TPA: ABC transporter substrate-binding protein [Candidatus Tectomicrobia bacterium]|nr:ABC transporter substrate-binding protein [Candidatus Tectomicrobia bacterium]
MEDSVVLRGSLRDLGYVEGRNVTLEIRTTRQTPERIDDLAQELVRLPVDIIVATHPAAVFSARRATATIPIVMVHTPDPVELGLVKSLARPGGNITGVTSLSVDVSVKQLQILREVVPMAARVAMLWNPDNPWHPLVVKGLRERPLGVQIRMVEVRGAGDLEKAFETVVRGGAGAVLALADPMMFSHRRVLAHLAVRHRLPLMGGLRAYTQAGALMSYWADEQELVRRAATYVDRILKGAHPGALPIEQPSKYDLIVNVTTARALGLTIPPSLLLQADEVIE